MGIYHKVEKGTSLGVGLGCEPTQHYSFTHRYPEQNTVWKKKINDQNIRCSSKLLQNTFCKVLLNLLISTFNQKQSLAEFPRMDFPFCTLENSGSYLK